jgi:hypothetical protein
LDDVDLYARGVAKQDWSRWYDSYDDPDSTLSRRLVVVQARIRDAVDAVAPGPIRVVSMCAGDGRDLLGALADHRRRADVHAVLVELNPDLAERGRTRATDWDGVEFVVGDAAITDHYADAVPADLVLVCGVFGNISEDDIVRTVRTLPELTATGGTVIWTRHREAPDLVPTISAWFEDAGFQPVWLSGNELKSGVGVHRFVGEPRPLRKGQRIFEFWR